MFGIGEIFSGIVRWFFTPGLYVLSTLSLLMPLAFCVHANGQIAVEAPHLGHYSNLDHHTKNETRSDLPCADHVNDCYDGRPVLQKESAPKLSLSASFHWPATAVHYFSLSSGGDLLATVSVATTPSLAFLRTTILLV
ncbi:MAG: hypothetical protein R3B54_06985 [Bdellovibrionota bacterium]